MKMKTKILHASLRMILLLVVVFVLFSFWYLILDLLKMRRQEFSIELRMFSNGLLYSTIFSGFFIPLLFHLFNFSRKKFLWAFSLTAFLFLHTFILGFILNGDVIQFQPLDFGLPRHSLLKTCILVFVSAWISDTMFFLHFSKNRARQSSKE